MKYKVTPPAPKGRIARPLVAHGLLAAVLIKTGLAFRSRLALRLARLGR